MVVGKWSEITKESMEKWWRELSPRLEIVKWMLVPDVWFAFITQPCPITTIDDFLARMGLPAARKRAAATHNAQR